MPGQHEELKRAIRSWRNRAGITSDQELALRAGVHVQTLQNWMYGKTTPRPDQVSRVAQVLNVPMADLMAIYEGRPIEPPPLQDAIRELISELRASRREQHESMMALLQAVQALVNSPNGNPITSR